MAVSVGSEVASLDVRGTPECELQKARFTQPACIASTSSAECPFFGKKRTQGERHWKDACKQISKRHDRCGVRSVGLVRWGER